MRDDRPTFHGRPIKRRHIPDCLYCGQEAEFMEDSSALYKGRNYGPVWICRDCEAWVGCHTGTPIPLGRLADAELRRWKSAAHASFDRLWKAKIRRDGVGKGTARAAGYAWLANKLGIPPKDCHIGMFDIPQCQRVVEICAPYLKENRGAGTQGKA